MTATVRPVEEAEATGQVAAIFADIKATKPIDFVPDFWQVWPPTPTTSRSSGPGSRRSCIPRPSGAPRLDPLTREIIALAVSATNGCRYCINSHTAAVRELLGVDVEALGEVLAVVGLFNSTNAIADGYQVEPDVLPPRD